VDKAERDAALHVKVPCKDEGDFYARLAHHIAENGLRVPTEQRRPVGARVAVALELRNGRTLMIDGVIDQHVQLDSRAGVCVKLLQLDGNGDPRSAALEEVLFADGAPSPSEAPAWNAGSLTTSGEIVAAVSRRTARVQRAAIGAAVAAMAIAALVFALLGHVGQPDAAAAAKLAAADRLLSEGRIHGKDGALEHLLAAKRLRPDDPATATRLSKLADLLEALGARALERGDLAVARVHHAAAELAAPDRASIHAKLEALAAPPAPARSEAPRGAAQGARASRRQIPR